MNISIRIWLASIIAALLLICSLSVSANVLDFSGNSTNGQTGQLFSGDTGKNDHDPFDNKEYIKISGGATRSNFMTLTVYNCSKDKVWVRIPYWRWEHSHPWFDTEPFTLGAHRCAYMEGMAGKFGCTPGGGEDNAQELGCILTTVNGQDDGYIQIYAHGYHPGESGYDDIWWHLDCDGCERLYPHNYDQRHLTYRTRGGKIVDFYLKHKDMSCTGSALANRIKADEAQRAAAGAGTASVSESLLEKNASTAQSAGLFSQGQTNTSAVLPNNSVHKESDGDYLSEMYIVISDNIPDFMEDDPHSSNTTANGALSSGLFNNNN